MDIREDLRDVSGQIARLLALSNVFAENNKYWAHLKNDEDFNRVYRIPEKDRYKVESIYADGRDMAIYMMDALAEINFNYARYPTLTSIIEGFQNTWVYGNYNKETPDIAKEICSTYDIDLWSVRQMFKLFKDQEKLLAAVRATLAMLQNSNLYKEENGMPTQEKHPHQINLTGINSSSININSDGASAAVNQTYNEPAVFSEIITAIKLQGLDPIIEGELIDNTHMLAAGHKSGTFKDAYIDFMQNVSAHITVFGAFLPALSALL
ncbi:hypothetical protein PVE_R1G0768 [Pseudomonas veronii 1YdBTEX2]|uniref:Uncharacterized protein n=1 Tax=Pseudomonas veronii 1YdBTEX2 TaxID=1295141 RepID=A0A1D3JRE0_PSEVE|nr:hypothetical protein [Pseudomonas veronii]SBW78656.1 hypothetical protein PVE_R1G0768 [Pseudomonas veronii 1YdBTEX2]